MAKPPIPEDVIKLLQQPNHAVMATVRPDGAPVTVATWYLWDDGRILLNLDAGRKRLDHMRADPRVSLTVLDGDSWYRHISLQGTVTISPDSDLSGITAWRSTTRAGRTPTGNGRGSTPGSIPTATTFGVGADRNKPLTPGV